MAIKIYCDLCGSEREMNQIRGVETLKGGSSVWFNEPRMDHEHFVCTGCLAKIGIVESGGTIESTGPTYVNNTQAEAQKEVRRRRGVSVVIYWKNEGGFEVCNSIAAAVDRIAEKTGTVIQGANISHALLKDKIFNADEFVIRNAETDALNSNDLIPTEGEAVNA